MNPARISIALFFNRIALVAGLLLVVFLVLVLVGRSLIPTPEQREALSLMTAPAPTQEGSAWPALRLLGYDLDPEQQDAAWAAEWQALLAYEHALRTHLAGALKAPKAAGSDNPPPRFETPLSDFAERIELRDLPQLACIRAPSGCSADVVKQLDTLATPWAAHSALRERLRALADTAHSNIPEDIPTVTLLGMPPSVLPVSLLLTDAALLWGDDPMAGLALGCRLHAAGRRHALVANNLITRTMAQRLMWDSARLTADLVALADASFVLPSDCLQLIESPGAELSNLCTTMQGEFRLTQAFETLVFIEAHPQYRAFNPKTLLRSAELELYLRASAFATYCQLDLKAHEDSDRPIEPDRSESTTWPERVQCVSAIASCISASTLTEGMQAPMHASYLERAQDDAAMSELFSASLALRQTALRGEDLRAAVAGLNARREGRRPILLAADQRSISIELRQPRQPTERNWLPLASAQPSP